jgi:hypothetical protein
MADKDDVGDYKLQGNWGGQMEIITSPSAKVEFNGEPFQVINFKCPHCEQKFDNDKLEFAIFLYGAIFLSGKKDQYAGTTCPRCLNTILFNTEGRQAQFFNSLSLFFIPGGSQIIQELKYYSSPSVWAQQEKCLEGFLTESSMFFVADNNTPGNFTDSFEKYLLEQPDYAENYLCSYTRLTGLPIGPYATVFWYKPDDIPAIIKVENDRKIRLFPRYYPNHRFLEKLEDFCWDYYTAEKLNAMSAQYFEQLKNMGFPFDLKMKESDLNAPSRFFEILITDFECTDIPDVNLKNLKMINQVNDPFQEIGFPESWSENEFIHCKRPVSDKEREKMITELKSISTKGYVHQFLKDSHLEFTREYIDALARTDFSYGTLRELQFEYLKQLYETAHLEWLNDAEYAFFPEGDTWTIIFEKKALRKLSNSGFKYLHRMVSYPGRLFYTVDLDDNTPDPYKPKDGPDAKTTEPAMSEEDPENIDYSVYDDEESEGNQSANENYYEIDDSDFDGGKETIHSGFNNSDENIKQMIDTNGSISISSGKIFENRDPVPVIPKKVMPEVKKLRKKFFDEIEKANNSHDAIRKEKLLKAVKVYKRELFNYMRRPKNHFSNATDKEINRISQAIRRAILEIRGDEDSPQQELRQKLFDHFESAVNTLKNGTQMYIPLTDIQWRMK